MDALPIHEENIHDWRSNPLYDFNDRIIVPAAAYWCALTEKYSGFTLK
ncbi:amidohydrolase [Neisseria yangbaofengii]|nr:amidohydrolase [Neisseria yangbaofengii]